MSQVVAKLRFSAPSRMIASVKSAVNFGFTTWTAFMPWRRLPRFTIAAKILKTASYVDVTVKLIATFRVAFQNSKTSVSRLTENASVTLALSLPKKWQNKEKKKKSNNIKNQKMKRVLLARTKGHVRIHTRTAKNTTLHHPSRTARGDIDLQCCLVEDTACPQSSFVSSVQVICTCLTERQSPDLIFASRNGSRAVSLWAAAWATTTLLHIAVRKVTGQTAFSQYSQDLITATFVGSFSNLFSLPTALIECDILGIMSMNSSSFHCMQHIPVRLPIASISTY